jgi:hypothetical protein
MKVKCGKLKAESKNPSASVFIRGQNAWRFAVEFDAAPDARTN